MGINPATAVHSGRYLFVTSQYGGARMLVLDEPAPGATVLWEGVGESDQVRPRLQHAELGD